MLVLNTNRSIKFLRIFFSSIFQCGSMLKFVFKWGASRICHWQKNFLRGLNEKYSCQVTFPIHVSFLKFQLTRLHKCHFAMVNIKKKQKSCKMIMDHPKTISTKFDSNWASGLWQMDWNVESWSWTLIDHDRMVVRFSTTCAISAYHYLHCEFESHSWRGVLHTTFLIKFVSDLRQVGGFLRVLRFPHQ